jgi:hypothetical protein
MNFDEIKQVELSGVEVLPNLNPASIYGIQTEFALRSAADIRRKAGSGIHQNPIFPAKGSIILLESIARKVPLRLNSSIEWIIANKVKVNGVTKYVLVSNKRGTVKYDDGTFSGIPKIYDDVYDSGLSYDEVEKAVTNLISPEDMTRIARSLDTRSPKKRTRGVMGFHIATCTTKEGKPYNDAIYTFPAKGINDGVYEDYWITSSLGLDGGKGDPKTSRLERLAGVAFAAKSEAEYTGMMNDPEQVQRYNDCLEYSGIQCYGEEGYSWKNHLLEIMDDERYSIEERCMRVFASVGLAQEA